MTTLVKIVRILMGALFTFGGIAYFFNLVPQPELAGNLKVFMEGVTASTYLMPLIKVTELVCGLAFVAGYYVPLAAVVISPVIVNILCFSLFLDSAVLPVAIFLTVGNLLVAYAYRERFRPLFIAS